MSNVQSFKTVHQRHSLVPFICWLQLPAILTANNAEYFLLGCDTMQYGKSFQMFRRMYCFNHLGQRINQASYKKHTLLLLGLFFDPRNRDCAQNTGTFLLGYMAIMCLKRVLVILTPVRTSNPITNSHMCVESVIPVHLTRTGKDQTTTRCHLQ